MTATLSDAARGQAAEMLFAARRDHAPIAALPEACRPGGLDDGYAVQQALVAAFGQPTSGWKIGCTSPLAQQLLGTDAPFAGRMFRPWTFETPAELPVADFPLRGVECEIAVRLGADLPDRGTPYDADGVAAAIAAVYPAIEVIGPAYAGDAWMKVGVASIVADLGAHGAEVLGPAVSDWQGHDLAKQPVRLLVDGEPEVSGVGADALGHPLNAVAWLANERIARGEPLGAGELISTGSCTGFKVVPAGVEIACDCPGLGRASLRFV
jgi:2-oxo-3-hexenedioate decarboxylase/2-keto-4-pentenoate hydratase